jgi:hypothetical protein
MDKKRENPFTETLVVAGLISGPVGYELALV